MTIEAVTWEKFRARLLNYAALPRESRCSLLFRGQPDNTWNLVTTLDREHAFVDDDDRDRTIKRLLDEFQRESLEVAPHPQIEHEQLELLARHHGLPSPLMDWTSSPYVAAYFAFAAAQTTTSHVSVWVLDRRLITSDHLEAVDILDSPASLRFNLRAFRQRGIFLRARRDTTRRPLNVLLEESLNRFDLPVEDRKLALADLDEMRINAATLFADLGGVATTVAARIAEERHGT